MPVDAPAPHPVPPPLPPAPASRGGWTPQDLQWAGRGYLSLAGGLLLLPILYFVLVFTAHRLVQILLLTACTFMPVFHGLNTVRPPRRRAVHTVAMMLALVLAFLTPFLAFWGAHPSNLYFRANLALHALAGILWLADLHLLVCAQAVDVGDAAMRIEATSCLCLMAVLPLLTGLCLGFLATRGYLVSSPRLTLHPALAAMPFPLQALLLTACLPYFVTLLMLLQASNHAFSRALEAPGAPLPDPKKRIAKGEEEA